MARTNHQILGDGIKLYTDAMRAYVKERLISIYPNNWWESGVVRSFTDGQKSALKKNIEREPKKDKLDHIDPGHIARIVIRQWKAFEVAFGDFSKTRSYVDQVTSARNTWAHARSGDVPADEVGSALYAMKEVLEAAGLAEAAKVDALRKEVLGVEKEPAAEPARELAPAKAGDLPYWWQKGVCEPHDAFKNPATIDESLFAATLGGVHAGAARDEYLDPRVFFAHTYFTENLKQTISDVASRMSGGDGPSVTELQTPFGGGKTHALLTLYHLIRDEKASLAVPGVKDAIGDVKIPSDAKVLLFDGQEYGTDPIEKEDTTSISSMWGELAYQASPVLFRKLIADSDSRGEAPGNAIYRQLLEDAAPCLILIDELVSYLVKLRFSNARRTKNLYRQTVQFVQELLQLAGNVPKVCVLISLPKSQKEFGGLDPEQVQQELAVLPDLQARADRVVSKRTPVNDEEIYTLVRKRLFAKADPEVASRVAKMYRDTYERTRGLYDAEVFSSDYERQMVDAYPLNPELIDVLYKKWSAASDFPRTRAVLQLLANIVADQWVNRRETYTIHSAHVNLERERIRTKIVSAAGGGGWDSIVAADIIGSDAHADSIDERRGAEYQRFHVARGLATTLLMHSFSGQVRAGALPSEMRLGTVAPNIGPEYVAEVVESLETSLWYVHREGELLRFQNKVNIYRVIAQKAETLPASTVRERLRDALASALGSADGFRVLEWAGTEGAIADSPELRIAVLEPGFAVAPEDGDKLEGRDRIDQLWEKAGGGFREWRNALILVAPDRELWTRAEDAMREVMSYEGVLSDIERGSVEVSSGEQKDLKSRAKEKSNSLRTSITTAYRWVFHPDEESLSFVGLNVPATRDERVVSRIVERLSNQDYGHPKILKSMGAVYFNSKLAPRIWKDGDSALDLEEAARRFQQWTYLPILPQREEILRSCVREGLRDRLWCVAIGSNQEGTYTRLIEQPEQMDDSLNLFDGSASLVKGSMLELVREQLGVKVPEGVGGSGGAEGESGGGGVKIKEDDGGGVIPVPTARLSHISLKIDALEIAKTGNLQPYLFKVIQEYDAGAEVSLSIEIESSAGIPEDVLKKRIIEGLEMLGIAVRSEAG